MNIREQLAANLARYRKYAEYTQKDAAKALGTKTTTLSSWERGVSQPDADMLVSIAFLYRVSLSDLCGIDYDLRITSEEHELIKAYRSADDLDRSMVKRILNVREKNNSVSEEVG